MNNLTILAYLALAGFAFYFSFRKKFSFLFLVIAAFIIAARTNFIFISLKFIMLLTVIGVLFYGAGRVFPKISKTASVAATAIIFILIMLRIC
ncbi:MAG: hypothetical protein ABIH68_06445 [bacterium]